MRFKHLALILGLAALGMMVLAPAAMAGVVGSNHDIITKYPANPPKAGTCSFCHIPHKAGGDKLWASTYSAGTGWRVEVISQLCYTCHGTGTSYTEALELNPFGATNKHQRTVSTLTAFGDIGALPGTVPVSDADSNLKCTSCHDVHNNDNRPFIRYMGATTGVYDFSAHCLTCHPLRANSVGQETANSVNGVSQHPTDQLIQDDDADGLEEFQATIAAQFSINPGTNSPDTSGYNLGGHRTDGGAATNMNCATCHTVHGNETTDFTAADGATQVAAETTGFNNLLVMEGAPGATSAAVCIGCHLNDATAGPGGTGTISHPIDSAAPWASVGGVDPATMGNLWGGTAPNDVLVCQSCHDMHYAENNTSILYGTISAPVASSNANCDECHSTSTKSNHHPAGFVDNRPGACSATDVTELASGTNWVTLAQGDGGSAYQFGPGGEITCGTCHGGASSAHNNATATGFPGLAGDNTCSDMCVDCHTFNPSVCSTNANNGPGSATLDDASHYLGPIATAAYARAGAWTNSGLSSEYCAGTPNQLICESCHTLQSANAQVSSNVAEAGVVDASITLLLEVSGNNQEVHEGAGLKTGPDMCTGCHGASPSGGAAGPGATTHPTLADMAAEASASVLAQIAAQNAGTVSVSPTNFVNCESCHRPHDAAAGSGCLTLEGVGTGSTKVANDFGAVAAGGSCDRATGNGGINYADEAVFCVMCHNY